MKILYICGDSGVPALGRKGASVHVREMIGALGRAGHHVILAAQTLQKSLWETPATVSIPVIQIKPGADSLATTRAVKEFNSRVGIENSLSSDLRRIAYNRDLEAELLRRFDSDPPDVIYERASLYGIAGGIVARALRRPLVIELNAPLATEQATYRDALFPDLAAQAERVTLSAAQAIFVVSQALREHVTGLGIDLAKVHIVPNGIDPGRFRPAPKNPALRARLGLDDAPVLGFVGGLRPWHGVEILPDLLERLSANYPQSKLAIVGSGPLQRELQKAFDAKFLSKRVLFLGALPHDEVAPVIREFDIALAPYPAHAHSFYFSPLKLFECLGSGVATVAADVGQIREVIEHGKTGWLYPAGDLEALVASCEKLLSESRVRQRIARAGAKVVHAQFTWDHNARRLEEVVRELQQER